MTSMVRGKTLWAGTSMTSVTSMVRGETLWVGTSTTSALSLGRVDPAPHTEHLLGPFAAIAQNSALWSFSIVESLANRQHNCGGSEELAIWKTAGYGQELLYTIRIYMLFWVSLSELAARPRRSECSE